MMRRMRAGSPTLPRVIVYVFACPLLPDAEDEALAAELAQVCAQEGVVMVDRVVDRGPPKARADQYPVLARISSGEADALLVVRSPMYRREAVADRLESICDEGPFAWLAADDLHKANLLPPPGAAKVRSPRRPAVGKRAIALRGQGQGLRLIGQTLTAEGYRAPGGVAWTAARVAKLLGIVVMQGGRRDQPASEPSLPTEPESGLGTTP